MDMTRNQTLTALRRFRSEMERLSSELPDDRDFWPAYAEQANALEAGCPLDLRDFARDSIFRTIDTISRARSH
jgi:hypothetical protein